MSRKFIVELDDKTFEELKQGFMEAKKITPGAEDITFEQFLSDLLKSYADVKNQMGSMGDNIKNLFSNFDGSSLEQMLSKLSNLGDPMADMKKSQPKEQKNTESKTKNEENADDDLLNKFKS